MNDLEKELLRELQLREAILSWAVMLATMGNEHARAFSRFLCGRLRT